MEKKYQIFARKYRPQTFKEVIGQEHIVTTLKNALKLKKVSSAYLFAGSRGTGKTTLARILAKALNCNNSIEDNEPCNDCTSCKEITSSNSLDVIEIDGASNRGIDDIRQINDTVGYAPSSGKYKIYIIDEVHMLTKEAFNALLKTLEEPPPSIKFFLATTEPNKVLPTIISRCQRFDLHRIPHNLLVAKLDGIAKENLKEVEEEALHLIARFAEGSLRDAESLLDQILCYGEDKIYVTLVEKYLGFSPKDFFFELDFAINDRNYKFAFELSERIFSSGKDFLFCLEELMEHFRNILLAKLKEPLSSLSEYSQKNYLKNSEWYSEEQILFILETLMHAFRGVQRSPFKRGSFELLLLEILKSKDRIPLPLIAKKLLELEKKIKCQIFSVHLESPALATNAAQTEKTENKKAQDNNLSTDPEKEIKIKETVSTILEKERTSTETPKSFEGIKDFVSVPFNFMDDNNITESPLPFVKKESKLVKERNYYDNILRFAAVELEGKEERG